MSSESIFSKIVSGELPCHKLYEDELTLAFLDINPVSFGHSLVIPKKRYQTIDDVPPETLAALIQSVQKVAVAIKAALNGASYNLLCNNGKEAGQEVAHVHFHIIPRGENDGIRFKFSNMKVNESELENAQLRIQEAIQS